MALNERTSARIARLAAIGVKHPELLTARELQSLCASVLTQVSDKPRKMKRRKKKKVKKKARKVKRRTLKD